MEVRLDLALRFDDELACRHEARALRPQLLHGDAGLPLLRLHLHDRPGDELPLAHRARRRVSLRAHPNHQLLPLVRPDNQGNISNFQMCRYGLLGLRLEEKAVRAAREGMQMMLQRPPDLDE